MFVRADRNEVGGVSFITIRQIDCELSSGCPKEDRGTSKHYKNQVPGREPNCRERNTINEVRGAIYYKTYSLSTEKNVN
jgi:hypothetical protein